MYKSIFCQAAKRFHKKLKCTGKSFSEALILASTNPQYDKGLFNDFSTYMKTQAQNMCTQIGFCFDIQNNLCTQHVLSL